MSKEIDLPNQPNSLLNKIPTEAFKKVVCECGCDIFQQGFCLFQYPGGLWHAKPVTNPMSVMVCWSCGKPYIDKLAKLEDLKKEKT